VYEGDDNADMASNPQQRKPPRTPSRRGPAPSAARPPAATRPPIEALTEAEIEELQRVLDGVPKPLDPLDVVALDGYLCAVLVQPVAVPESRWLRHVIDVDGRTPPASFGRSRLEALVRRRHAQLDRAIGARQWFDPCVFELEDDTSDADRHAAAHGDGDADEASIAAATAARAAVFPWVAGFATAWELFPALADSAPQDLTLPLALLYRHFEPDDLEDADALLDEIASMEPAADLADAVEGLVRATLLLADIGRPVR
jgi:uncharacterized protein